MHLKSIRAAALLCCAMMAGHAQAASYKLTSHVSGVAEYFNVYDFGFVDQSDWSGHTLFDITYRATVDYSGSGRYDSASRIPVEITISLNGKPAETSTISGWFSVKLQTFDSGPDAGKSYLDQNFAVYATIDSFQSGLNFSQRAEVSADLAGTSGNLPFNVPLSATRGDLDYGMYTATDMGDMNWGGARGQITSMSFALVPVPEPAGWAMLGAGLLLTGAVARRRVFQR